MKMSRRGFIGVAGATLALSGCGQEAKPAQAGELLRSKAKLPTPFQVPLPIPPVKKPTRSDAKADYYRVVQQKASLEILPGLKTEVMGYDGLLPGPTFDVRSGRTTVVEQVNQLDVSTVVHLHGGHTPAPSDGWPLDLIMPANGQHGGHHMSGGDMTMGKRTYTYPNMQRAATLWYHDHTMDYTAPQVYRGLFGLHIIRDDEEENLPLPKGDREIPLVIADRAFDADGSFLYPAAKDGPGVESAYMEGVVADVTLVNGAPWPVHEVDAVRYRFRILNAANARRYELAFDKGPAKFVQIGSDGGLLDKPVEHKTLVIAPAERFDVIVDFSQYQPGDEVTVVNKLDSNSGVLRFKIARKAPDDTSIPATLSSYAVTPRPAGVVRREWRFRRGDAGGHRGWTINGKAFDPAVMQAQVKLDQYEIWSFVTDVHHPVHVHLAPFQVLTRGGSNKLSAYDHGWKDTVDIRPAEVVEVLVKFSAHKGKYLIHCHNLEHEDMAMMAAFETI
ncbi:multicopper oxidase family protein [Kribbella sp. VKM Ac-2566]|uniref:multicopper oxidase family protein n=1 Tax=Kribbella sp. VKM Ac-2566 TaxID=2512218 RepID=UPI001062B0CA|nr:multicopper oxidase domain-containing protein [Kribbella sp. VKM Ac-2566]TDW89077.1 spore coat protein A [Kribbella sp. VKM Ac-2566]